jgi:hypothetical protein
MSKFPVEYNDQDSNEVVDAVNYVLSGPSGLGQNFDGYSSYNIGNLTGNVRAPFTSDSISVQAYGAQGATTITVDDVAGIEVGNYVSSLGGIAAGTTVLSIDTASTVAPTGIITLSAANTGAISRLVSFSTTNLATSTFLYVPPASIATITWLNRYEVRIAFSATPTTAFTLGNCVTVSGNSVSAYNKQYTSIGIIQQDLTSTVTYPHGYIIVRATSGLIYSNPGVGTGGTVSFANTLQPVAVGVVPPENLWVKTDAQANAVVTGPTDRVFISGQVDHSVYYTATASSDLRITVGINRYIGAPFYDPVNPGIRYTFDTTVAERQYLYPGLTGTGQISNPNVETLFTTFIDQPGPGYYLYRLEMIFRVTNSTGDLQVTQDRVDVRALSVQVVKQ